jgi:hypothetical protein
MRRLKWRAWMTTETSDLLLPGYWVDSGTGAWCTLPWPTDPEEKMALVNSSLGPALIDWAEWRTDEPGLTDYMSGEQWRFTPGQKRFLILAYHVQPDGRFTYRSVVKRGAKGTGKDPGGAAVCNGELLGPVELYDWDDKTGRPLGRRRGFPLVQVLSNSEAQSKDVLRVANAMWSREAREYYGLDCGETRTIIKGTGARFEIPPTSEASGEGDPATHVMLNETHHMTDSSGGKRVAAMARRNVAKAPSQIQARVFEYTNAHRQGMDSEAEGSFGAWQDQQAPDYKGPRDILYDSIEAPPDTDILTEEGRHKGLRAAYMDAPWNDIKRISDEMADRRTTVADSIRFYLNGLAAEEDSWVEPARFDRWAEPREIPDGEQIAIFGDCSKSEDATGIYAVHLDTMYAFAPGDTVVWQKPHGWDDKQRGRWLAPRHEVDAAIRSAMDRWDVQWLGIDPSPALDDETEALYWRDVLDGLHRDFRDKLPLWATPGEVRGNAVVFDMRLSQFGAVQRNMMFTEAAELVQRWIDEEEDSPFRHDGNPHLRNHVHQAKSRPTQWGTSLAKVTRDSSKRVDLAVCMVGAVMGARIVLNSGKRRKKKTGKAVFW